MIARGRAYLGGEVCNGSSIGSGIYLSTIQILTIAAAVCGLEEPSRAVGFGVIGSEVTTSVKRALGFRFGEAISGRRQLGRPRALSGDDR